MKKLERIQFGNPILRKIARQLSAKEIKSRAIQKLIVEMKYALNSNKYGVGLAAPQVGHSVALSVLSTKPTPSRPDNIMFEKVIINPKIIKYIGKTKPMWEGCISMGSIHSPIFAQVQRFPKIIVQYFDENADFHEETHDTLISHLMQHEIDHLEGILFVDKVEDTQSYMNLSEYKKRIVKERMRNATKSK